MATVICPACGARYQVQAVFPPGGRKARCYKCGKIWLATPVVDPAEPVSEAIPVEPVSAAPAEPAGAAATVGAHKSSPPPQSAGEVNVASEFPGIIHPAAPQPTSRPMEISRPTSRSLPAVSVFEASGMRDAEMGV